MIHIRYITPCLGWLTGDSLNFRNTVTWGWRYSPAEAPGQILRLYHDAHDRRDREDAAWSSQSATSPAVRGLQCREGQPGDDEGERLHRPEDYPGSACVMMYGARAFISLVSAFFR
jgi:hypothetical protein